ncbi:putative flagellar protein [plant metagenome]|uniref:Putative flagellar protein n=2 Tax=root TaxID=1 RepID=A0A1C3JXL0_9BURK|nr:flagellar protein FlaG [Orrella dioscoreae]SBT23884.1 putative flagellar protein [Orrella dioscoreae]SOE49584.1 putative flagellar protein [Orrella dioscoreae]
MAIPPVTPAVASVQAAPILPDSALQLPSTTVAAVGDAQKSSAGDTATSNQGQNPANAGADNTTQTLEGAIEELNRGMQAWSTQLQFEVDPDIQRLVVSVLDAETGDTIRTIPSEAVLRMAKIIVSLQGQIVNAQA